MHAFRRFGSTGSILKRFSDLVAKPHLNSTRRISGRFLSTSSRGSKNGEDEWNDAWEAAWLPEDLTPKARAPWETDVNFPSEDSATVLSADVDAETKAFVEDMNENWNERRKGSKAQQQEKLREGGNGVLYSVENMKKDYRLKKQRIHASLWMKEIEKMEEAKFGDSTVGGGDDIERLLDSCSGIFDSGNNDIYNAKVPSSSELKHAPDGWETTVKTPDGNIWEMSQREEDILLQEFDRRIAYCKFQIASFVKTHIFSRRRPIDGWKYMIEVVGPNAKKGKGSVSRVPTLSDASTQPFKEDKTLVEKTYLEGSFVSAIREEDSELQHTHHHRVQLSSLIPSSSCGGSKNNGSLEVVHKHGPCSKLKQLSSSSPSSSSIISHSDDDEILEKDEGRVRAIQSKLSKISEKGLDRTQLPAKSGIPLGEGNYFVTVALGSPKRDLSLIFDTGSDITWTQCKPCSRSCYPQKEPIFDPSQSSSYSNISCSSSQCFQLISATGIKPLCSASTKACIYRVQYGDGSFSIGYYAKEKLTVSPTDVFNDFLFGCGQNNQGLFRGVAGLLGLGRDALSFVEQTAVKYRKIFSYCLPSSPSTVGFIAFGGACSSGPNVKFTPFSSISRRSSFYGVDFTGITVAGINLQISASVFSSGMIIDSGTVITRLPPSAYGLLRDEFWRQMSRYPKADPVAILDTCFNLKGYEVVYVPTISLSFGGGVTVKLDVTGILEVVSEEKVCLAFTANKKDDDVAILGNTQQKTLEVVYDVAGERIGFRPRACK